MRVPTFLLASLIVLVILGFGCSGEKQEQAASDQQTEPVKVTPLGNPDDQLARAASEKLIEQFSTELRTELMTAMSEKGAAEAISICSKRAPQIAEKLAGGGWSIRRTSQATRNLQNQPIEADVYRLQQFEKDSTLTQAAVWDTKGGKRTFRYFKPIYVQQMCTTCHGDRAEMDPQVVATIDKLYPDDRASGYRVGGFRGMFAVAAEWPEAKARAEQLAGGSTTGK